MRIVLGGVRGTSSISHPEFMRFGGETTAVLVESSSGACILMDAGTGIHQLGCRMEKNPLPKSILLLMTHYHLDHLMGLPSLTLLYRRDVSLTIASPRRDGRTPEEVLPPVMSQPYWPVEMDDLHGDIHFLNWEKEASETPYLFDGLEIRWCSVRHPGGCTAYRIDEPGGGSMVFATDIEWLIASDAEKKAFLSLCREPGPPSVLLFDGQYSREEYAQHKGWGHSSWQDAVEVAGMVEAERLLITHHSPRNNDRALEAVERELQAVFPAGALARDGMIIEV